MILMQVHDTLPDYPVLLFTIDLHLSVNTVTLFEGHTYLLQHVELVTLRSSCYISKSCHTQPYNGRVAHTDERTHM